MPSSAIGDFLIGYSPIGDTGHTSWPILAAIYLALTTQENGSYPTIAGQSVFMPRDWPVQQIDVPIIKISPPEEDKESTGRAGINFETTCTVELILEVSAKAESDDAAAAKVLTALAMFQREVELAVIGNPT